MRLSIFFVAAFLLVGSAQAEWFLAGRNENFRVYVDQQSIQRNGASAQMLQLMDFVAAQWVDARTVIGSIKTVVEYDCRQPRSRALAVVAYSEQMAEGRVVSTENFSDPPWEGIQPGSTPDKIRQTVCGK